jgi:peptide/nickel transport system substrate-binding protein
MKRNSRFVFIGVLALCMIVCFWTSAAAKDTLVYVMGAEPPSLDPPNQSDNMSETLIRHIYDNAISIDEKANLVPGLFVKWEHSADGRTWTWHLRKGVKFQDGTPFNAEAVKVNFERGINPVKKVRRRSMYMKWCEKITVIDEHTVQTWSKKPFAPTVRFLTHPAMAFVSPAALKKHGDQLARNPMGTGPFMLKEWVPGDRMVLVRNDAYWGEKPKLKKIIFRFVKESSSRVMMLETGEADVVLKVPPVDIERLKGNADVSALALPSNRVIGFYVNCQGKLTKDVRFRKALLHAVDRETIIKYVMKGIARPVCSMNGGGTFTNLTAAKCYDYDPERAKALLKEMGYKGEELVMLSPQGRYTMDRETGEAVHNYWQEAGINAKFRVTEFATLVRAIRLPPEKATYQVALLGSAPSTMDGAQNLIEKFTTQFVPPNGRNYSRYVNPEYDKYAEAQGTELDVEKRLGYMGKAEKILSDDLPFIPLYLIDQVIGVRKNVKGLEVLPTEHTLVRYAYFE